MVTELVDMAVFIPHPGVSPLNTLVTLVLLLPSLAMMVRRLHDIGRSGWWLLLTPTGIGIFILLYLASLQGNPGKNEYDRLPPPQRNSWLRLKLLKDTTRAT